jgi:hypothetical protein
MTKTLSQIAYSDLTPEEHDAVKNFFGDNGVNYSESVDDPTWVIALNANSNVLLAMETNVFGAAVTS